MPDVAALLEAVPGSKKARKWAVDYGDDLGRAWHECWRGDWVVQLATARRVDTKCLVLGVADCVALAIERTGEDPPAVAGLHAAVSALEGSIVVPGVRTRLVAASEQEDTARACACKATLAILDAVEASDDDEVYTACNEAARYATTALTFVAMGPKVHRKLAQLVRARVSGPEQDGSLGEC